MGLAARVLEQDTAGETLATAIQASPTALSKLANALFDDEVIGAGLEKEGVWGAHFRGAGFIPKADLTTLCEALKGNEKPGAGLLRDKLQAAIAVADAGQASMVAEEQRVAESRRQAAERLAARTFEF